MSALSNLEGGGLSYAKSVCVEKCPSRISPDCKSINSDPTSWMTRCADGYVCDYYGTTSSFWDLQADLTMPSDTQYISQLYDAWSDCAGLARNSSASSCPVELLGQLQQANVNGGPCHAIDIDSTNVFNRCLPDIRLAERSQDTQNATQWSLDLSFLALNSISDFTVGGTIIVAAAVFFCLLLSLLLHLLVREFPLSVTIATAVIVHLLTFGATFILHGLLGTFSSINRAAMREVRFCPYKRRLSAAFVSLRPC